MINWFPPALIHYTDALPEPVGGSARGPYIRIRPRYKDDASVLEHELAHVEVFWMTLGLSLILRRFRRFRLWNEARAYIRQSKLPNIIGEYMTLSQAAERMVGHSRYDLGMSHAEVLQYLTKWSA